MSPCFLFFFFSSFYEVCSYAREVWADQKFNVAGPKSAFGSAVGCAILLGVFEGTSSRLKKKNVCWTDMNNLFLGYTGVGVVANRMMAQPIPQMQCKYFHSPLPPPNRLGISLLTLTLLFSTRTSTPTRRPRCRHRLKPTPLRLFCLVNLKKENEKGQRKQACSQDRFRFGLLADDDDRALLV